MKDGQPSFEIAFEGLINSYEKDEVHEVLKDHYLFKQPRIKIPNTTYLKQIIELKEKTTPPIHSAGEEFIDKHFTEGDMITQKQCNEQCMATLEFVNEKNVMLFERLHELYKFEEEVYKLRMENSKPPPPSQDRSVSQPGKEEPERDFDIDVLLSWISYRNDFDFLTAEMNQYVKDHKFEKAAESRDHRDAKSKILSDLEVTVKELFEKYHFYVGEPNPQPSQLGEGKEATEFYRDDLQAITDRILRDSGSSSKEVFDAINYAVIELSNKYSIALKSRPSEGWSESEVLKIIEFTHGSGVYKDGYIPAKEVLIEYKKQLTK